MSLWVAGDDGVFRIADVNEANCELAGQTRAELIGSDAVGVRGDPARATRDMSRALRDGTVVREIPRVMPDGQVRDLRIVYVSAGPRAVLAFVVDITSQRHAEERLRIAENRYRTLVAAANEGVWLVDSSGRTSFANAKVGEMLGRPLAEVAERNVLDFVDPRDRTVVAAALECPRDTPTAFEARFLDAAGRELLCLMSVSAVPGDGPSPATLCLLGDMTGIQRERRLRRETEERFRWIVETASEGIWTGDPYGRTTFVNAAGAHILGVDAQELVGRRIDEFVEVDRRGNPKIAELGEITEPVRREYRIKRQDGRRMDVVVSLSLLRDDAGELKGALGIFSDITRQKAEHAELRESRERFAQVFELAPVGLAFIGAGHLVRGRFLGANRAFRDLLGYSEEELLELDVAAVTHPDDIERERALTTELFETERADYELEKRFVRADGSVAWSRFRVHLLRDEYGAPLYGLGLAVDIGAEKAAAQATVAAAARASAVLRSTPDAVIEIDADGRIAETNDAALRMFGAEQAGIAGKRLTDVIVSERTRPQLTAALESWRARRDEGQLEPAEIELMRADGSEFPAELRAAAVADDAGLVVHARNLAPQARAEAARRGAEQRFERLFRDSPLATATIDPAGRFADANAAFCRLAGREPSALVGHAASAILAAEAGTKQAAPWAEDGHDGPVVATRRVVRPDGQATPVQATVSPVSGADGSTALWLCQCLPKQFGGAALPEGDPLSYRERQVLGLLAQGHDGPAIAERLSLSPETVRSYAQTAREKLGAGTRTQAVALALMRGEISI